MEDKKLTGYPSVDKPWLKYYSEEAITGKLPEGSIYDYMRECNIGNEDAVAIHYLGNRIKYRHLFQSIQRTVQAFLALGIKKDEIVSVCLPSVPEALYIVYALNYIGAVANMLHPLAGRSELISYFNEAGSKTVILFTKTYQELKADIPALGIDHYIVVSVADSMPAYLKAAYLFKSRERITSSTTVMGWNEFINNGRLVTNIENAHSDNSAEDRAIMVHTGGTTGIPKGVVLSNRNVNSILWSVKNTFHFSNKDRMLSVLPPFIGYALCNGMLEPLALGMSVILIPKYEPEKIGYYLKKYRPNHMNSIPQFLEGMLNIPKKQDLSYVSNWATGGDSMSPKLEQQINELLDAHGSQCHIVKGYGCSEMVSCVSTTYENCNEVGSVGIPLVKNNVKIVEPGTEKELSYNEEGEICISGPSIMMEYYHHQDETDELIHADTHGVRWLHTGDLGYVTENGSIFVVGRLKRIFMTVNANGQPTKLFPDRIEKELMKHSSVEYCVAIGKADKERVYIPIAFVKLNIASCDEIHSELTELCANNLPTYMLPDRIIFIEEYPRTERGKIDYRKLEEMAAVDVDN